jgi:hypothetical protein
MSKTNGIILTVLDSILSVMWFFKKKYMLGGLCLLTAVLNLIAVILQEQERKE